MANKVLTFGNSIKETQTLNNEVYRDLSMVAKQVSRTVKVPEAKKPFQLAASQANGIKTVTTYSSKVDKLVNVNAIKNSIHNIFSWTPGERILNPEFGSKLRKLLYEGITDFNQELIIAEIRNSVSQWEPRVRIDDIVKLTSTDDVENNTVYLRVIYSIPSLTTEQFYYDYSTEASS